MKCRCPVTLIGITVFATATATAQRPGAASPASATGSYALGAECKLEIGPVAADSVHVQLLCRRGPPSYHLGFIDDHVPFESGAAIYDSSEPGASSRCQIRIQFFDTRAVVTQDGNDLACGFGGGVSSRGTYRRTSRTLPAFDLSPCG